MKKTLLMIAAVAMAFVSCDKDGGNGKKTELKAEVKMEVPAELQYGQPVALTATVVTDNALTGVTFVGVRKSGETYEVIGEDQAGTLEGNVAKVNFFADTKEMTDIAVIVAAGKKEAKAYFPVEKVAGELPGTVWFSDPEVFKAAPKVATHDNDAVTYPAPNTGAGCDMPSFFSMHGMKIGNEWKHVVSLSEARPQDGKDVSFAFVNVLENTAKQPDNLAYIGSQRGFAFCTANRLTAGTVGRQCDAYEVDGHGIKKMAEQDANFKMRLVRGSWKGADHWNEQDYKFIDGLYLRLKSAKTDLEKMKAYYELGEIQRVMDNATLVSADSVPAEGEELTAFGGTGLLRQFVDFGPSAKSAVDETWRAGDYILFRSARTVEGQETPKYYYGIMQIQLIPDISKALNAETGKMDNIEEINNLFGKPLYVGIKTQCELK